MSSPDVAAFRAFNRFYTRLIGVLDAHLVQSPFNLTEARVLYEIAHRGQTASRELARELGLDGGYLSRILGKLNDAGLVAMSPSDSDRRSNEVALTPEGKAAFAALDAGSDAAAEAVLAPLSPQERRRLAGAMATVRALLDPEEPSGNVVLRPPRTGEVALAVARQSALYGEEYGWDGSYEPLAMEIATGFLKNFDPNRELCLVAELAGEMVGAVFVVDAGEGVAKLRLLYVEQAARGRGIGRQLVHEAVAFARARGYRRMRLWTQSSLIPARRIYAAAGFRRVSETTNRQFGHDLVSEDWELDLAPEPAAS